jgi:hypothetical protein
MQDVSFLQLVTLGYGVVFPILGYFLKDVMNQVKELQKEYNSLHEKYLKKDDFHSFKQELWSRFDRIETKLDGKPDGK